MSRAAEYCLLPLLRSGEDVIFNLLVVDFLEFAPEDWIRETGLVTNTRCERDVGIIEVRRTPGESPSVEGYK